MPATSAVEDAQTCRVPAPCERDSFVFTATECGPLRLRNFYARHFRPAVARARLPKQLRFHDLRHTCAALPIANGRHMEDMKDHLGHSSIRVTSDRYGHLFPRAPQERPTGSTRLTGMQPRAAGPMCGTTPLAPRLSTRAVHRALPGLTGGCEYPVEEPRPSAPSKKARREARTGVSRLVRVGRPTAPIGTYGLEAPPLARARSGLWPTVVLLRHRCRCAGASSSPRRVRVVSRDRSDGHEVLDLSR